MNAERLLGHFERIADAPDSVDRLRQLILDLAVRGKLVPQDPMEEPTTELMTTIRRKRQELIRSGTLRREIQLPAIKQTEAIFAIPSSWAWVRANEIWDFENGDRSKNYPSRDQLVPSGVPFVNAGHLVRGRVRITQMNFITREKFENLGGGKLRRGDQLYCLRGSLGKHAIYDHDGDAAVASSLVILRPVESQSVPYLSVYLDSDVAARMLRRFDNGSAQPNLSSANLRRYEVPLPPLAEQRRIVAKVDELMSLCDRLEAGRNGREAKREQLTMATFARLNTPDPDPARFADDARFAVDVLSALTARRDQIQRLRQTILNLAVRGKLVRQDPADEPARELLKRIVAEKKQPAGAKAIRNSESVPYLGITTGEFALLPSGWELATLDALCTSITDGDHLPPPKSEVGIPFLVIGNVRSQSIEFAGCRFVPLDYYEALHEIRRPRKDDVLYTLVGSFGIPVLVRDDRPFCVQRHIGILRPSRLVRTDYLARALESSWVFDQATKCATGIAQKTVPLSGLRRLTIPVPPLNEQSRIVAKVQELRTLCDQLEASLSNAETTRSRLLEALLADALAPVANELHVTH